MFSSQHSTWATVFFLPYGSFHTAEFLLFNILKKQSQKWQVKKNTAFLGCRCLAKHFYLWSSSLKNLPRFSVPEIQKNAWVKCQIPPLLDLFQSTRNRWNYESKILRLDTYICLRSTALNQSSWHILRRVWQGKGELKHKFLKSF
jgi:hypothetical protein